MEPSQYLTMILDDGRMSMNNKYRLTSTVYEREREADKVEPLKIYFISVEGNATEKEYFDGVSKYREKLGINAKVNVEVLRRSSKDTNSAPEQVVELLEEYLRLREEGKEDMLNDIPLEFRQLYTDEFIQAYLDCPENIPRKQRNRFCTELKKLGYDINYRKYLAKYQQDMDEFCVMIGRDMHTHSEANMSDCIEHCRKEGYRCFIANPCFEFWLLLHLTDVRAEYNLDDIQENKKLSGTHTFVSREVSARARHGKSGINFEQNYLAKVGEAVARAKEFASDEEHLIEDIGCNLWKLIEDMQAFEHTS